MDFEDELAENLKTEQLLSEEDCLKIQEYNRTKLFSLNLELRTLLYTGVLLATTGLGIAVYKNIDTIGHDVIIGLIAVLCSLCFVYCFRKRTAYTNQMVSSPDAFFDYILLSGCILFLTLEGYLQYQHHIFGERYGIATLIPALLFFPLAYLFDHKGVLSMAITALCAWVGITVTPLDLLTKNDFSGFRFIYAALTIGILLSMAAFLTDRRDIKKHFSFTYLNFAANMMFVAALSGIFSMDFSLIYLVMLAGLVYYFIRHARKEKSFYFFLIAVIYGYIGITWEIFYLLFQLEMDYYPIAFFGFSYLIVSSFYLIKFLKQYKKILGTE